MALTRRKFINLLTVGSTACLTLLTPLTSFAAWASDAFNATKIEDAYQNLFGSTELIKSPQNC